MRRVERTNPTPVGAGNGALNAQTTREAKHSRRPTKINRVFAALASGRSYNRFEAARELHDTCLHSTVSDIQQKYGVQVLRSYEVIPGYLGAPTTVCRYRLAGDDLAKARKLLGA